jgi:hypothetical protein
MTAAIVSEEDGPELAVDMDAPETILINHSNSQLVQRAIEDVLLHYREAFLLREVEEMSYREIAEILSNPIGTVMSRLARARKSVRESLLSASPAMRLGLSPIVIPSALTEKSVHHGEVGSATRARELTPRSGIVASRAVWWPVGNY